MRDRLNGGSRPCQIIRRNREAEGRPVLARQVVALLRRRGSASARSRAVSLTRISSALAAARDGQGRPRNRPAIRCAASRRNNHPAPSHPLRDFGNPILRAGEEWGLAVPLAIRPRRVGMTVTPDDAKKAKAARYKVWREANLDKLKGRDAAYYAANAAKLLAQKAAWRAANPDKLKAWRAAYRAANPDKVEAKRAATYAANREKELARAKAYRAANRARQKAYDAKRRAAARLQRQESMPEDQT
jgi:hypothetical protein